MSSDQNIRQQVLDITKSFLVQAPAGSGKTSLLVQRFLSVLAVAQSGPEEVVAITFTRKAAAEMRERILNVLQAATQPAPTDEYALRNWQLAQKVLQRDQQSGWHLLDNPARLKIQTIDALCASITKQMPILSRFGAPPQIEQHPEYLYELTVDHMLQALDHDPDYPCRDGLFVLLRHLDNDRLKVKKLLVQMLQRREHWLPIITQHRSTQNLRQVLESGLLLACEEALEDLAELVPPVLDVTIMNHDEPHTIHDWLTIIDKLLTKEGTWRKQVGIQQGFHPPSKATNKEEKQRLQACKAAMHTMLEALQAHENFRQQLLMVRELPPLEYTDAQWGIVAALIATLPVLAAQLTVVFRDQGKVDFIAVALAAISALQDQDAPTDLALALDCKIRHILVDEFQDTSHTQFRLLEHLTATWEPGDGRTLFLVGDPMQSIYRFRQADVGLFLKAKDHGVGNVQVEFVQLKVNFRSSAAIIQWINQVFTSSFPAVDNKTLGAITYMSAQAAKPDVNTQPAVECIAVSEDAEPVVIVDMIQRVREQQPNCSIAILVRAKSHVFKILPALRATNIAYQAVDIENLSKRPIIQDLLALTKAILHFDDRIAWLAILRAPWCGLRLVDLEKIAQTPTTIFAVLQDAQICAQLSHEAQIRVQRFTAVLRNASAHLGRSHIVHIVQRAYADLGGAQCLRNAAEHAEVEAFFEFLTAQAHKAEIYNPEYLEQQLAQLFLPQQHSDPHAVQIMTMHKSKGLEFDVVILPGLTKTLRPSEQQLLLLEQRDYVHQFLLLAPIRAAADKEDAIYNYLNWCERQREEFETLRQLYVATTRAKQKIICLGAVADPARVTGMLEKIWPQVANTFTPKEQWLLSTTDRNLNLQRLPVNWFLNQPAYHLSLPQTVNPNLDPWQANWVNQAGTVLHRMLWNIANQGLENLSAQAHAKLPSYCRKLLHASGMPQQEQTKAQELIMRALHNMLHDEFGAQILSAQHQESYAEFPLTVCSEDKFTQVRLDRVFVDQTNTVWVVDYKLVLETDNLATAIQAYTAQILHYAKLVKMLKPNAKLIAGLYFPLQAHWQQVC